MAEKKQALDAMKNEKKSAAKYMIDEITHIIKSFGKRDPGSDGETKAIEYMETQLKETCDEVKVEPFDVYPSSFMGWIYFTITFMLIGVATYFFLPIISVILAVIGFILMFGQFIFYREWLDKCFKKRTSHNITAIKKPTGEVKRRIFFNGHPDSAYEWTVNYHIGGVGFIAHVVLAILGGVVWLGLAIYAIIANGGVGFTVASGLPLVLGLCGLVFVPFLVGMYWMWNEKIVTDGANDNLTGCYMGIALMKDLKDKGIEFENTEVGVIISGSEEAGLRGAKAWSRAHKGEYQDVETLIFAYDTIHAPEHLCVNKLDMNLMTKADAHATKLFYDAAQKIGVKCGIGAVPLGATDSAAFNQAGFKAVGITGLDHNLQDYYHTRRDTYDNLSEEGIADCYAATVQALDDFDNGL